jgi:hypothetical protein
VQEHEALALGASPLAGPRHAEQRFQPQAAVLDINAACRLNCSGWSAAREARASQADSFAHTCAGLRCNRDASDATHVGEHEHISQPDGNAEEKWSWPPEAA